jgi:hypothetical protein
MKKYVSGGYDVWYRVVSPSVCVCWGGGAVAM